MPNHSDNIINITLTGQSSKEISEEILSDQRLNQATKAILVGSADQIIELLLWLLSMNHTKEDSKQLTSILSWVFIRKHLALEQDTICIKEEKIKYHESKYLMNRKNSKIFENKNHHHSDLKNIKINQPPQRSVHRMFDSHQTTRMKDQQKNLSLSNKNRVNR